MKKVFAFDMGKASIGYCVREDFEIKDLGSLIIDKDHSSVADNRARRRVYRTLKSHRAREKWFINLWLENITYLKLRENQNWSWFLLSLGQAFHFG